MIRKTTNILTNENGAALVIALMMMIMLTLVGLGSIFTSTFEVKLSGNKRGQHQRLLCGRQWDSGHHG